MFQGEICRLGNFSKGTAGIFSLKKKFEGEKRPPACLQKPLTSREEESNCLEVFVRRKGNNVRGPQGHTQNGEVGQASDWNSRGRRTREEGTGRRTRVIQPNELTFGKRPKPGPFVIIMSQACCKRLGGPTITPSSKYQRFRRGPRALISSMIGARTRLKRRGPSGSPCCTPQEEEMLEWLVIQTWKRVVHRGKKTGAVHAIKCVSKINF